LFELAEVGKNMKSVLGDVRDHQYLRQIIQEFRPEIVIHMAAQSVVHQSYMNPVENYETNVMGTVYLLESIRQVNGVRAVVNVTSDKCYENREWVWGYRENEPLGGYDPYSNSKACSELVSAAYHNSFFNPSNYQEHGVAIATARAGNVIGGGDWTANGLVSDIVYSLLNTQPILIRNPNAIRPWQYVLDALNGYLTLAENLYNKGPAFAEAWNFGPYESGIKPVSWLVEHLISLWGEDTSWKNEQTSQFHEANFLSLDCSKARLKMGWRPKMSLEEALEQIVSWTKSYRTGNDMYLVSKVLIQQFMEMS
jgi:CDP-glucose 4,6-dehydratase